MTRYIKKYNSNLILVITGVLLVGIILIAVLLGRSGSEANTYTIEINGDNSVVVYQGSSFIDPGAKAYDDQNNDLSSRISISSNLDTNKLGRYEIVYALDDIYVKRTVRVIKRQDVQTGNFDDSSSSENVEDNLDDNKRETTLKLNGEETIYLELYGTYDEEGYNAVDTIDGDISKKVVVTHNIDNSKAGNYQIVYTVKNSAGVTTSIARNVIVMKVELKLSLGNSKYTNEMVAINVNVDDKYMDYLVLPNGQIVTSKNYIYNVSENGVYKFTLYNKHGVVREKNITVNNIDRSIPSGSCSGSYKNNVSTIKVVANDDNGISKYVVNGVSYITSTIQIKQEISQVNVEVYDNAGNKNIISCTLEDKNQIITSDKSISFSYQFVSDSNISYGLYTPSSAKSNETTPLIVWLHGSGSVGASHDKFKSNFLSFLKNWKLEGFNAYVVCPLLSSGSWNTQTAKKKVYNLIDEIIREKNINTDKVILAGHSMGAQGIFNIADGKTDYYSALVFLSPYSQTPASIDISQFKNKPLIGYVGTVGAGEDSRSYNYAVGTFSNTYGSDKLIILNTWHGNVPNVAFTTDSNKDNKSDLIEWMLSQ